MSRSSTPTLPWAIPMYHRMESALQSAMSNMAISQKLRLACTVAPTNFIITFAWLGTTILTYSQQVKWSSLDRACTLLSVCTLVCHPALRLEWFRNLGDDAYNQARIIFECFINEYELATAAAAPPTPKLPLPSVSLDDEDSFLSSIINLRPDGQHPTTLTVPIQSEFERYAILAQVPRT